jgi:hypothetical protein
MTNQQRRCTQCGQTDDHPRVLINPDTPSEALVHYDCLPADLRGANEYVATAVQLAESGVHGDDLRAQIYQED